MKQSKSHAFCFASLKIAGRAIFRGSLYINAVNHGDRAMSATTARAKKIRLGDLLVQHKAISQEQLNAALADQKKSGRKLGRGLVESGYLTEDQLLDFLSRH